VRGRRAADAAARGRGWGRSYSVRTVAPDQYRFALEYMRYQRAFTRLEYGRAPLLPPRSAQAPTLTLRHPHGSSASYCTLQRVDVEALAALLKTTVTLEEVEYAGPYHGHTILCARFAGWLTEVGGG
jgi:hypothetical protein